MLSSTLAASGSIGPASAVKLTSMLLAFGLLISTIEHLSCWYEFQTGGIYSWKILSTNWNEKRFMLGTRAMAVVFDFPGILVVYGIQAAAAAAILLQASSPGVPRLPLILLGATQLLVKFRYGFGEDGSDQMKTVIALPLALYAVAPSSLLGDAALLFIALQSCLAYTAAGIAKASSRIWRSGEAVFAILNTRSYGNAALARCLRDARCLKLGLAWSVIVLETLFPLCVIVHPPLFWVFLLWGLGFHIFCAFFMGLNNFVWAFVATYPALLFVRQLI